MPPASPRPYLFWFMMLGIRWRLLGMLCGGTVACRPSVTAGSQSSPSDRFPHPEAFAVVTDSAQWLRSTNKVFPRYPDGARARGEQARVIAAFIIDTTGAPELPSITLLTPANDAFDQSVCAYFRRAHFTWRAGPPRRALFVWPFEFELNGEPPLAPSPDLGELSRMLDALPRTELVQRLSAGRHCQ